MNKYFMRFFDKEKSFGHLKGLCIFLIITVIMSQIGLFSDVTRNFLTAVDILDGASAVNGNGIVEPGEVILSLDKGKPGENITILINGDEYSKFDDYTKSVRIKNQSVIEIVNDSKNKIEVSVTGISDNLTYTYKATDTSVDKISVICRVIFRS